MKGIYKILLSLLLPSVPVLIYYIYQSVKKKTTNVNQNRTKSTAQTIPQNREIMVSTTNNPLNIRPSKPAFQGQIGIYSTGSVGDFAKFSTLEYGYRAAIKLLNSYFTKHGLKTIIEIISRWAPSSENNTTNYVDYVSKQSGFDKSDVLTFDSDTVFELLKAMAKMETSSNLERSTFDSAWNLAGFK